MKPEVAEGLLKALQQNREILKTMEKSISHMKKSIENMEEYISTLASIQG